jgi:hypothetical protein
MRGDMFDLNWKDMKDRRRRPEEVNRSQSKFLDETYLYPEIYPTPLSSNSIKTAQL